MSTSHVEAPPRPPSKPTPDPSKLLNPVLPGMHPDPTVCRVGDTFYLATSSFGLFPGVPLYSSQDLNDWHFVRHILSRPSQLPFHPNQSIIGAGIFAPTLRHDGERFCLVTTNHQNGENFLVTAENPEDEWSEPIWLEDSYQGGIDPSITILEPGRALYQVTADSERGDTPGLTQFEIDLNTGKGLTPRRHLSTGCGWKDVEGPHLFERGGHWYLLTAEGGTLSNHRVAIARSESPWGPWENCPHNPILTHSGLQSDVQNTGHSDLFDDASGNWWIAFLGVRPLAYPPIHILGRETYIAPVEWTSDGWPIVNKGQPVSLPESGKARAIPEWIDEFDNDQLHPRWLRLGPSYDSVYQLGQEKGITIHAAGTSLSEAGPKGFVGTRLDAFQRHFELTLSNLDDDCEAGITIFMEKTGYYSLGIVKENGRVAGVRFTRHVLDMETLGTFDIPEQNSYPLRVELCEGSSPWTHQHHEFVFSLQTDSEGWREIGRGSVRLLSTELIGGFGGLLAGMYCIGNRAEATATFKNFSAGISTS